MSAKKKTLTPEEMLQEALVPEEEQPYEVPENWVWVRFCEIRKDDASFGDGDWILSKDMDTNGNIRLLQLSDIGKGVFQNKSAKYISEKTFTEKNCSEIFEGDILISRMADPIARSCIVPKLHHRLITAVDVAYLRPNEIIYDSKYVNLLCNTNFFKTAAEAKARGTTRKRISRKDLGQLPIPLPPKTEQKRIVARVELLLDKINQAKELIAEARETFADRRAAILAKAFRGELTKKWREQNPDTEPAEKLLERIREEKAKLSNGKRRKQVELSPIDPPYELPEGWCWVRLGDVFNITSGGTPSRKNEEYYNGTIPWVKTGEIKWNYIEEAEEKITDEAINNSSAKILPKGSVLVAMYGQGLTRGRAAILNINASCNQAVCALTPNPFISPLILFYFFMEGYYRFRMLAKGGNQENLSATVISNFEFPLIPYNEQQQIIQVLQTIMENEQHINQLINLDEVLEKLTQNILKHAFRGQLGTNDPTEDCALKTLKEIIFERYATARK